MFIKGHGGYRIGIHMKEYHDMKPIIVYGGAVKEFFGELAWEKWEGEWDERYVAVIAPDVAVFQGIHHATITTADGNVTVYEGAPLTVLYRLMDGSWEAAIVHFSWAEPNAAEGEGD